MGKKEEMYMVLDDTVDIGKEPLPIETEQDKEFDKRMKELEKEFFKRKKST